jgi:hypothetical protein
MPIPIDRLRSASSRYYSISKTADSLMEARRFGLKSAFLCHSHKDVQLVEGLIVLLRDNGWRVYVDWKDTGMPERPSRETAEQIQSRIRSCEYFLFLATSNSMGSRWCPWEIGFADGVKNIDAIFVVPTSDSFNTYGNEYLDLYRKIDLSQYDRLLALRPKEQRGTLIELL